MPEIKGDFIHIPVRDPSEFTDKCATITLDKDAGIKALICRRKDKDTTAVRTVLFPVDKFTMDQAEKWITDHPNLESYYVKDLLYTGTWPHPQQPDQDVHMTLSELRKIYSNLKMFLAHGGNVPVVYPPHPDEEVDTIDQTVGFLQDVMQLDDQSRFYGILKFNALATAWAREGKIKAVSPSIVYKVRTAHGEYDVLFDHICITQEPYLTKQDVFKPVIAEAYSKAVVLYESTSMTYPGKQNGGKMVDEIKKQFAMFKAELKQMLGLSDGEQDYALNAVVNLDVGYCKGLPKDEDSAWDFDWAADGDAIIEKGGYALLNKITLFKVKDADPESKAAYKYPVAKLKGGEITLYWGAVRAAMARLHQQAGQYPEDVVTSGHNKLAQLYKVFDKEPPELEAEKGDKDMQELEKLKGDIANLQAENATLKKENETLTTKITEFEATKQKVALEAFKADADALVKDGLITAAEATEVIATYEAFRSKQEIKYGDVTRPISEVILAPYKTRKEKVTDTKLSAHSDKIRHGDKVFDLSTAQGRNEFAEHYSAVARKENISLEDARRKVMADCHIEEA